MPRLERSVVSCGGCGAEISYGESQCSFCNRLIEGADAYRLVEASWKSQADVALAVHSEHSPDDLHRLIRHELARFAMAPGDLSRAAEIRGEWAWVPVLAARCTFSGSWQGAATPYKYVTRRGRKGTTTREKRRLSPKVFKGRIAASEASVLRHGSASAEVQIMPVDDLVQVVGAGSQAFALGDTAPSTLLDSDDVRRPKRYLRLDTPSSVALDAVTTEADKLATQDAEEQLEQMTPGDWENRGAHVEISIEEANCCLFLVPALIGRYSYRGASWPFIASGATGKVTCGGSPTSGSKLLLALGLAAICIVAVWHWKSSSAAPQDTAALVQPPEPQPSAPIHALPSPLRSGSEALLEQWLRAQNARDLSAYRQLYAAAFVGIKGEPAKRKQYELDGWLADRKKQFARPLTVKASDTEFSERDAETGAVRFVQTSTSGRRTEKVTKELLLKDLGRGLQIIREEQLDLPLPTAVKASPTPSASPDDPAKKYGAL